MSLKIRLSRGGAKKRPFYSIVIADARSPRDGRFIERVGTYNPMVERDHPERLVLKIERLKHWLSVGASPTDRVERFLADADLVAKPAQRETPKKSAPQGQGAGARQGSRQGRRRSGGRVSRHGRRPAGMVSLPLLFGKTSASASASSPGRMASGAACA